jgi:Ni/Fe-hydrogenase 1 B-type cytochrome subunit
MDLTQVNVWLDIVFRALYVVVVVALSAHLLGNFISGRMRNRFVRKQWPVHDGPHPTFLPRFLHFQHVFSMFALGASGMYIRFPYFYGGRTFMRYVHYFFMVVVVLNLLWRLWYAFLSKRRDYREFKIKRRDITTAPLVILYYIFVKPSKPHIDNYNVMQKGTYIVFAMLLFVQALTGFSLLVSAWPPATALAPGAHPGWFNPQQVLLGWFAGFIGGVAAAGAWMRLVHYVINWLFIILTTIHAYLSVTEDFPAFENFFGLDVFSKAPHPAVEAVGHAVSLADGGADH